MAGRSAGQVAGRRTAATLAMVALIAVPACSGGDVIDDKDDEAGEVSLPPTGSSFDYQLGGAYPTPEGVGVVVRQWSDEADPDAYSICYVNAFQTEATGDPDDAASWPQDVVWYDVEDPDWPGEHPIDIGTQGRRRAATEFVEARLRTCAANGFQAVELDNLDSFTRYPGAPFDRADTIAYARMLVAAATGLGLAVAQKNTVELLDAGTSEIGFGFAIVEQCGEFDECQGYVNAYGGRVFAVEYTDDGLAAACAAIGDVAPVIERDLDLVTPGEAGYVYATC